MNVFAWTSGDRLFPAYMSVNRHEDGSVTVTVRGPADGDRCGATVRVAPPADELAAMAEAILARLDADRFERWKGKPLPYPDVPRRCYVDRFSPAEAAIHRAMAAVEGAGGDVRLTKATALLAEAKSAVADWVDWPAGKTAST